MTTTNTRDTTQLITSQELERRLETYTALIADAQKRGHYRIIDVYQERIRALTQDRTRQLTPA